MHVAEPQRPDLVWSTGEGSRALPEARSRVHVEDADMQAVRSLQVLGNQGLLASPDKISNHNT